MKEKHDNEINRYGHILPRQFYLRKQEKKRKRKVDAYVQDNTIACVCCFSLDIK